MSKQKEIYIVAQYYGKPRDPKMTRVAGYMADENNVIWDERIDVTAGLKQKDLLNSKVVINISTQEVVKDSFRSGKSFEELFSYFYDASPKEIANAIRQFGITVRKTDESDLSTNVQAEEEKDSRPEPTAAA